jgi:hypothetical protein
VDLSRTWPLARRVLHLVGICRLGMIARSAAQVTFSG